jgi:hydroxybutyrate-dimer hydrolase
MHEGPARRGRRLAGALAASGALAAGAAIAEPAAAAAPGFITGPVVVRSYDGASDDLLTAGLGAAGLAGAMPAVTDPKDPKQLRRLAIYNNYRALVDVSPGGGYGTLYGPAGRRRAGEGRRQGVPGASAGPRRPEHHPAGADPRVLQAAKPCIVTGPSSGSRGIYGAIGTSGEWGLRKGCAVAYTDKGTGIGAHDLADDVVTRLDGVRGPEAEIGRRSNFTAPISDAQRVNFNAQYPNRYAFEHAHSERNPERDWGRDVVRSVEFAFWALNEEYPFRPRDPGGPRPGPRFTFDNTLVIGSSVSNGGGASLRAAEQAPAGMFDGIAVSEPNVNPRYDARIAIKQGADAPLKRHSRPLFDYITFYNLFQGCASVALPLAPNTCQSLQGRRPPASAPPSPSRRPRPSARSTPTASWRSRTTRPRPTGRRSSTRASASPTPTPTPGLPCSTTCAATPSPPPPRPRRSSPYRSPTRRRAPLRHRQWHPADGRHPARQQPLRRRPARNDVSTSPTFNRQDQNVSGALCLRALATGYARDDAGPTVQRALYEDVRESIAQVRATGRLRGVPTIIVHGRSDALIAPNHSSRPYYALSRKVDGGRSRIAYYEIVNAQHLDAFNAFPDFAARYVPLHRYFIQALDLLYAHLTDGKPLPASQVVRTTPRGAATTPIAASNVPPIAARPKAGDRITFDGRTLRIPD